MNYKLIYINKMGFNHKGEATYEFIFTDTDEVDINEVWGDNWEAVPAEGNAQPPDMECISKVGIIKCSEYELDVAHDSQTFSLGDCKDGIFCLGYELIDDTFTKYPRLVFAFGESLDSIEAKLKKRKLELKYDD